MNNQYFFLNDIENNDSFLFDNNIDFDDNIDIDKDVEDDVENDPIYDLFNSGKGFLLFIHENKDPKNSLLGRIIENCSDYILYGEEHENDELNDICDKTKTMIINQYIENKKHFAEILYNSRHIFKNVVLICDKLLSKKFILMPDYTIINKKLNYLEKYVIFLNYFIDEKMIENIGKDEIIFFRKNGWTICKKNIVRIH